MAPNRPWSPMAARTPKPTPTSEQNAPVITASPMTDTITCLRWAPRARSRASSRVRWATMMLKVFTIRNVPTSSATPANTSRTVVKNEMPFWTSLAFSLASSAPVTAS